MIDLNIVILHLMLEVNERRNTDVTPQIVVSGGGNTSISSYTNATTTTNGPSIHHRFDSDKKNQLFSYGYDNNNPIIGQYIRKHIFSKVKFITSKQFMEYDIKKRSICQQVCSHFSVPISERRHWWTNNKRKVDLEIGKKRAECSHQMMMSFFGKFILEIIYIFNYITNIVS